jgi:hypothetical protein
MMHADFDLVTGLLGRPDTVHVAGTDGPAGKGSVAEVVLGYPQAIARCSSSSLMPKAYGMRGGYRATFTGAATPTISSSPPAPSQPWNSPLTCTSASPSQRSRPRPARHATYV